MRISTKLQAPSLRSDILFRKDLIKQLRTTEGVSIHSYFLPGRSAASGKTSLICQWTTEDRLTVAWYSLDQEDNEPDLFYRYLQASFIHDRRSGSDTERIY